MEKNSIVPKIKRIHFLLILACFLLTVKYIVVDFGLDAAFQISMSYRFSQGDIMFREMWEPYQTSVFLCSVLIKMYTGLFHTTTGIVLFIQFVGVMIDLTVAILLYRTLRKYEISDTNTAFAVAVVFFLISPKDVVLPEYANMQVWFTLLLGICLYSYVKTKKKPVLVLSALFLCMAVLSYPSCLLLFIPSIIFLIKNKDKSGVAIFAVICVLTGIGYCVFLIMQGLSVQEILASIHYILGIETSHSMSMAEKLIWYLRTSGQIALFFAFVYGLIYLVISLIAKYRNEKLSKEILSFWLDLLFLAVMTCVSAYFVVRSVHYTRYAYAVIFPAFILVGFRNRKRLNEDELCFYVVCTVLSYVEFVGTLMLTNLGLIASLPYLLIAGIVSFMPISKTMKSVACENKLRHIEKAVVLAAVLLLLGRDALLIRPYNGDVSNISKIGGIVKEGPALGVITEYMGAYIQNETIKEWREYIPEGSNIYIVGDIVDTLPYLYSETDISAPSLVPTPGYNEMIAEYWDMNPDKYPDVMIVCCWYGDLHISEDSWIMGWIEDEFQPSYYIDGKYYRYYFR